MPFWGKVTSTRVPGCQRRTVVTRAPRILTFSVNVISLGTDSSGQESSAANICEIRLSDRPSDRPAGTDADMNPRDLPDRFRMSRAPSDSTYRVHFFFNDSPTSEIYTFFLHVGLARV